MNLRQPKPSKDLASRMADKNQKLAYFVQEIEKIKTEGEIAPPGCWIVRYPLSQGLEDLVEEATRFKKN